MKITIVDGPYKGKEFEFNSPSVTIGRDGGNQLILDTDGVSRCHAEIKQLADGSWIIGDLNSTNGVKVGGKRIDGSVPLSDGTLAVIGENSLCIEQLSPEPARVIFNPIISGPPEMPATNGAGQTPAAKPAPAVFQAPPSTPPPPVREEKKADGSAVKGAFNTVTGLDIKNLSGSLFGTKGRASKASAASEEGTEKQNDGRKKRSNLIFYTVLTCVVIMVLSSVFSFMNPAKERKKSVQREQPLDLSYEKEVYSKDNVFRFSFALRSFRASGAAQKGKDAGKESAPRSKYEYKVVFTIDDIASRRHFEREVPLSNESVEELRQVVRSSGIYATSARDAEKDDSSLRRLTVAEGDRVFKTAVAGKFAPQEFEMVEDAVINLTETFGIKAISMTPAELIAVAKKAFINAEDLYGNRRAGSTNLRTAIRNYKLTVESLEQFSPKPPQWNVARNRLAEAIKEREMLLGALETEYKKLLQLRSFEAMKPLFRQMMDLTEPESPRHSTVKRRMILIEQLLRKNKR